MSRRIKLRTSHNTASLNMCETCVRQPASTPLFAASRDGRPDVRLRNAPHSRAHPRGIEKRVLEGDLRCVGLFSMRQVLMRGLDGQPRAGRRTGGRVSHPVWAARNSPAGS